MKKSPHRNKNQRSKEIRHANRTPTEAVEPMESSPLRLKKGLLRSSEDSPQKVKRAHHQQSELLSLEKTMEQKKSKNAKKHSKRTTPGKVDYPTTKASAHPQKGYRFSDINRKHSKSESLRMSKQMNRKKSA